jgi:hypothetical protein
MSGHPLIKPNLESAGIQAALDNYVIASRNEELAIARAMIRLARSEEASLGQLRQW